MLTSRDLEMLQTIARELGQGGRLNVEALAARLRVTPALVSQALRRMERDGWVERIQEPVTQGRVVYYVPKPWVSIQWSSPPESVVHTWRAFGEVDWDFPLVSQVPDTEARVTLVSFLQKLREARLLDASISRGPTTAHSDPNPSGLTFIVYGSTARGQARVSADVDVVGFYRSDHARTPAMVQDVAAEISLKAPRAIHLMLMDAKRFDPRSDESVHRYWKTDGVLVFDGLRPDPGRQSLGFWKLLHGDLSYGRS